MENQPLWKKVLLGLAGILTLLAGGAGVNYLGDNSFRADMPLTPVFSITNNTTTVSALMYVAGYKLITCAIDSPASTVVTGTIQFKGSISDSAPDFNSTASSTNQWTSLDITDVSNRTSTIQGGNGVVIQAATIHKQYEINASLLNWLSVTNTIAAPSGTIYVQCKAGSNA